MVFISTSFIVVKVIQCFYSRFADKQNLKIHINSVHEKIKNFKCETCDQSFVTKQILIRHKEIVHEGKKPFKCPQCEYQTSQKGNLNKHISNVHEGKKPFQCNQCKYSSAYEHHLKHHISSVHDGIKPFICNVCNAGFSRNSYLESHISFVHEGKKPFRCGSCDTSFARKESLKSHFAACQGSPEKPAFNYENMNLSHLPLPNFEIKQEPVENTGDIQTEVYDFEDNPGPNKVKKGGIFCTICNARLSTKDNLRHHIASIHEGKRPHQCKVCTKSFSKNSDLNIHVKSVHQGIKPFNCETCNSNFARRGDLKRHVDTVHEGIKPFQCEHCKRKFKHKIDLKRHIVSQHEKKKGKMKKSKLKSDKYSFGQEGNLVYDFGYTDMNQSDLVAPKLEIKKECMEDTSDYISDMKEEPFEDTSANEYLDQTDTSQYYNYFEPIIETKEEPEYTTENSKNNQIFINDIKTEQSEDVENTSNVDPLSL